MDNVATPIVALLSGYLQQKLGPKVRFLFMTCLSNHLKGRSKLCAIPLSGLYAKALMSVDIWGSYSLLIVVLKPTL